MTRKVPLYDHKDKVLGVVNYTANLDFWDGHDHSSGVPGEHIGIGKCQKGWYVCHGTQWEGRKGHARLVTEEFAKQLCLKYNPEMYQEIFFGEEPPDLM